MNLHSVRFLFLTVTGLALSLGASMANAQSATFNLPVEVRWGSAVLTPGHYTLSPTPSISGSRVYRLNGEAGGQLFASHPINVKPASSHSCLKLVEIDGKNYVREYVSATGIALDYAVPKAKHPELRAQDWVVGIAGS